MIVDLPLLETFGAIVIELLTFRIQYKAENEFFILNINGKFVISTRNVDIVYGYLTKDTAPVRELSIREIV